MADRDIRAEAGIGARMLIAQISDLHISTPGSTNDAVFRTGWHLSRAVAHLEALRPDLVVATGDLVERGQPEEYTILRALLAPLRAPLLLIPGNHDGREALRRAFPEQPWEPGEFLCFVVDQGPLRLIGLDTLVPGRPGGTLCAARLAWLEARLAEQPSRPTVLAMHHPPFTTGLAAMDAMGLDDSAGLAGILARHPQVERVICGHVHRPMVRRFAGTVVTTCASTAHQLALDLPPSQRLALVMEPPSVALHLWIDGALVTHTSLVGDERPPLTVYDGQRWLGAVSPPPGFHPG
jgi:Icc protein